MAGRKIDLIIIHCAATKPDQDIGAKEIRVWHTTPEPQGRGWKDIGYNWVIRRDGTLENGRDLDHDGDVFEEIGAHTAGYNSRSLGICLVGGINYKGQPDANFTDAQWKTLERHVRALKAKFPKATVHGHNEFAAKACPSFDVQKWLREKRI